MISSTLTLTSTASLATPAADATSTPARRSGGCDAYKELTVAQLGDAPAVAEGDQAQLPAENPANYCKPIDGMIVPDGMLTTIKVWNLPPYDPDEKVDYRWAGGGAVSAEQIPDCTDAMIASVAPPGSVRMPDLRRFGENQAKEMLAALGVTNIYVDYQDRSRIPDQYDQYAPYAVVSTLPAAGDYIPPDTTVVLGVRAPDPGPPPGDVPTPPVP
jgi:peptidoglycan glycosyltransferase